MKIDSQQRVVITLHQDVIIAVLYGGRYGLHTVDNDRAAINGNGVIHARGERRDHRLCARVSQNNGFVIRSAVLT